MKHSPYTKLLLKLSDAENEIHSIKLIISELRKKLLEAESNLVGAKLNKQIAEDNLKSFQRTNAQVSEDELAYEFELKRFKETLPKLLAEVKTLPLDVKFGIWDDKKEKWCLLNSGTFFDSKEKCLLEIDDYRKRYGASLSLKVHLEDHNLLKDSRCCVPI